MQVGAWLDGVIPSRAETGVAICRACARTGWQCGNSFERHSDDQAYFSPGNLGLGDCPKTAQMVFCDFVKIVPTGSDLI